MTGKRSAIYDALMTRVEAFASTAEPAIAIGQPNQPINPAAVAPDGKYIEFQRFPNRPAWEGLTSGVVDQGLLQAVVVWPPNVSLQPAYAVVDEILAHFAKGTEMFSGGFKVRVDLEPYDGTPIIEPDKVSIQITIPWKA